MVGNIGIVLLVSIAYAALWRSLPQEQPSLDQSIDSAFGKLVGRLQHTHVGFEPLVAPLDSPVRLPFKGGQTVGLNISYQNVGSYPATVEGYGAKLFIVPTAQSEDMCREVREKLDPRRGGGVIQPLMGGTSTEYIQLTDADAFALNKGETTALCGTSVLRWNDDSGRYETIGCQCLFGSPVGSQLVLAAHTTKENNKEIIR